MKRFLGAAALATAATSLMGTAARAQPGLVLVTSPNVAKSDYNELDGVAAAGPASAWAVGFARHAQANCCAPFRALIEHWNGTAWTLVPSPTITANNAQDTLRGVVALSGTDVWATGSTLQSFTTNTTLALHWNGTSWQIVPSADRGSDILNSVTGAGPGRSLWAVGSTTGGTPITATLIETTTG